MGLSSALSTATSGLLATQTWADITSRNVANASTEGYVRKSVVLTTSNGGVTVTAIQREVDTMLDRLDRNASSSLAKQETIVDALTSYTALLGQPDDEASLASMLSNFQTALNSLATTPSNTSVQASVLSAANSLVSSLNDSSEMLSTLSDEVEMGIKYDVADLNEALYKVADLNQQLVRAEPGSVAAADLQDSIGTLLDEISGYMDVQVVTGSDGRVNLYTSGGTTLLDGTTVKDVSYDAVNGTLYAGSIEITPTNDKVRGFSGGSLAGLFELKDEILPEAQAQLDAFAATLIQSFEAADASLTAGEAGFFTDAGSAYDAANLSGLASRITVNSIADPSAGGSLSHIRDGFGASASGAEGDTTQVLAFIDVFSQDLAFDSSAGLGTGVTLLEYASDLVAAQQTARTDAESEYSAISVSAETISSSRNNLQGVSIDDEMQKLLLIEQTYAANSKMMTAIIEMMDTLLEAV